MDASQGAKLKQAVQHCLRCDAPLHGVGRDRSLQTLGVAQIAIANCGRASNLNV
jgi:ribosomal protein L34E